MEEVLDAAEGDKDDEDLGDEIPAGWIMSGAPDALCAHHTKDGQFLFVGTSEGCLHVASLPKNKVLNTIRVAGPVRSLVCQGTQMLACTTDTHLAVFSCSQHPPFLKPHAFAPIPEEAAGATIVLSRDLTHLALTGRDGAVTVFKIPALPDIFESEEMPGEGDTSPAKSPLKSAGTAKDRPKYFDDSLPNGGTAQHTEPAKTTHLHHHDPVPAIKLFVAARPPGAAEGYKAGIYFCYAPKLRHVGEIQAVESRSFLPTHTSSNLARRPRRHARGARSVHVA